MTDETKWATQLKKNKQTLKKNPKVISEKDLSHQIEEQKNLLREAIENKRNDKVKEILKKLINLRAQLSRTRIIAAGGNKQLIEAELNKYYMESHRLSQLVL